MPSTPAISDGTPKIVLRKLILDHHHGELFVGTAEVVETDHAGIPYLIAAPTMRVPMILGPETVNPTWQLALCCFLSATANSRLGARRERAYATTSRLSHSQDWEQVSAGFPSQYAPGR